MVFQLEVTDINFLPSYVTWLIIQWLTFYRCSFSIGLGRDQHGQYSAGPKHHGGCTSSPAPTEGHIDKCHCLFEHCLTAQRRFYHGGRYCGGCWTSCAKRAAAKPDAREDVTLDECMMVKWRNLTRKWSYCTTKSSTIFLKLHNKNTTGTATVMNSNNNNNHNNCYWRWCLSWWKLKFNLS